MIWNEDQHETVGVAYGLHHVDYITIVRCMDCKNLSYTNSHWFCKWLNRCVDEDWFCADGLKGRMKDED